MPFQRSVACCDSEPENLVQNLSWVYSQGGGSRVSKCITLILWFEKPGGPQAGVEFYRGDAGCGALSDESLDRHLDFPRENHQRKGPTASTPA